MDKIKSKLENSMKMKICFGGAVEIFFILLLSVRNALKVIVVLLKNTLFCLEFSTNNALFSVPTPDDSLTSTQSRPCQVHYNKSFESK